MTPEQHTWAVGHTCDLFDRLWESPVYQRLVAGSDWQAVANLVDRWYAWLDMVVTTP